MKRLYPLLLVLCAVAVIAGCAGTLEQKQFRSDLSLSAFSKGYSAAVTNEVLRDPNHIALGVAILKEWKDASIALERAIASGDVNSAKFWSDRMYGDGTEKHPGIVGRAAILALNWEK